MFGVIRFRSHLLRGETPPKSLQNNTGCVEQPRADQTPWEKYLMLEDSPNTIQKKKHEEKKSAVSLKKVESVTKAKATGKAKVATKTAVVKKAAMKKRQNHQRGCASPPSGLKDDAVQLPGVWKVQNRFGREPQLCAMARY